MSRYPSRRATLPENWRPDVTRDHDRDRVGRVPDGARRRDDDLAVRVARGVDDVLERDTGAPVIAGRTVVPNPHGELTVPIGHAREGRLGEYGPGRARRAGQIDVPRANIPRERIVSMLDAGLGEISRAQHIGVIARDLGFRGADGQKGEGQRGEADENHESEHEGRATLAVEP